MVVLDVQVEGKDKNLYMDGMLHYQLTKKVKIAVKKKDFDWLMVVDGLEGSGKSVMAFQIAKVLDPNFSHKQIAFTSNDFIKLVVNAKRFSCVVFDEAFTGLSSRASLSEINQLLVSLMMECRQKNLFIILVMPSFFMLDKYAALHRAKGLFHIAMRKGMRGYWYYYNRQGKKMLYLTGKKFYEYGGVKPIIKGVFRDQYMVNEEEYRNMKRLSLNRKRRNTRAQVYKSQRDTLFWIMIKELGSSQVNTARLCKKNGYSIDNSSISDIIHTKSKEYMKES